MKGKVSVGVGGRKLCQVLELLPSRLVVDQLWQWIYILHCSALAIILCYNDYSL